MKTAVINIGEIFTGDLEAATLNKSCIVMEDGVIQYIGDTIPNYDDLHVVLDAKGATVIPGLIDSHVHVVLGDYTPRQKTVDFLESYTHGGITRSITASEVHAPGRPKDPEGVKALALMAQRCFENFHPGGMIVHGGSIILEPGLVENDFIELAKQGVWLAKAGFGNFSDNKQYAELIGYARKHGFIVMCHTGGASIPGSSPVTASDLIAIQPNVSGHVNGGPTAMVDEDLLKIVRDTEIALQIVQAGNIRTAVKTIEFAKEFNQMERVLLASDTPTGTGTMPLAVMKSLVELATLTDASVGELVAAASGNVGKAYKLKAGILREGYPGDLLVIDAPLGGTFSTAKEAIKNGDIPAIKGCFISGELRYLTSRNTPPPVKEDIDVVYENLKVWTTNNTITGGNKYVRN